MLSCLSDCDSFIIIIRASNLISSQSLVCGECKPLRPVVLNGLLVLATGLSRLDCVSLLLMIPTEYDWALSAILDAGFIRIIELYCQTTSPDDVPV
ncbi:hypothetical protein BLNAU_11690 [Blattamonas nauphoetae]|uniref:Uncharacterized protein n=1 Tax=Blattamonas nauphoetae TaxID=2049346 RepID=A0ABQ9XNS3_9EUKA|nr:hypothetical protein BLNAU_11690 [Blattamonas nauphoetae]